MTRKDDPRLNAPAAAPPPELPVAVAGTTAGTMLTYAGMAPPAEPPRVATDTPPVPEPTSYELKTRMVLVLGLVAAYVVMLGFLAVMWLTQNHPNLETPVMGGFAFLGAAATTAFGHMIGTQTTTAALQTGVRLIPDPDQQRQGR